MSKAEKALEAFDNEKNCAQAVVMAYAEELGMDKNQALAAATGFGGGMGYVQDTCGAVSGAVMVLGLKGGFKDGDGRDKIQASYKQVHAFIDRFMEKRGTIRCRDILEGCDMANEEGKAFFREKGLRANCKAVIVLACEILDGLA